MLIDIMHTVTSALQVPVVVLLMALAVLAIVLLGMLVAEFFTERRYFKLSVPDLVDSLQHSNDPESVIRESSMLRRQKAALFELLNHPDATPSERESMAVNIVAQEQAIFDNRVKVTDFMAKVGPMLGLMGTLIPLGPGIIAIGAGDTETLSASLLVAFDTTVTGLVVAALALLVSTIRKAWYVKHNAAFAAACEVVLEKANEGAGLSSPSEQLVREINRGNRFAKGEHDDLKAESPKETADAAASSRVDSILSEAAKSASVGVPGVERRRR